MSARALSRVAAGLTAAVLAGSPVAAHATFRPPIVERPPVHFVPKPQPGPPCRPHFGGCAAHTTPPIFVPWGFKL